MCVLPVSLAVTAIAMFAATRTVTKDNARMEAALSPAEFARTRS